MPEKCPVCLSGSLKPTRSVFVRVYEDTLIHVPNVPAWKCDICGLIYFDSSTIRRTEVLIGEAGPPPNRYHPAPPMPAADDKPAEDPRPPAETD
jgi:YgiT-type zinc finger domain-containing protein